jgi:hypothetical protein
METKDLCAFKKNPNKKQMAHGRLKPAENDAV